MQCNAIQQSLVFILMNKRNSLMPGTDAYLFVYRCLVKFNDFLMIPDRRGGRMNCFGFDQLDARFGLVGNVHIRLHPKYKTTIEPSDFTPLLPTLLISKRKMVHKYRKE